jgi:hypothetical protein
MKLAIMQPYFFPYIGYWQLIASVDNFVIYDDVNYIKQGWINRNNIVANNSTYLISMQLIGASSFKLINEIKVGNNLTKLLKTIEQTYRKSPYFENAFPVIQEIFINNEKNLAKFLMFSIKTICDYLEIKTNLMVSSELEKDNTLKAQNKIISICKSLQVKQYINAIGGRELYAKDAFSKEGIELLFIKSNAIEYRQFREQFVPNLSIIDILMFNDQSVVQSYLKQFEYI